MIQNANQNFDQLYRNVIAQDLCVRCGVCVGVCPVEVIEFGDEGYPKLTGICIACDLCNACCPGADVDFTTLTRQIYGTDYDPMNTHEYVENMYVAHSIDNKVRNAGTSGGVVTGLLLFLLKTGKIDGAIVVGMNPEEPYLSKGVLATTSEEILAAARSKYQITPSMEVLQLIRKSKGRYAVVGLPCQIHGLKKMEKADPELHGKIYCLLGLFCHNNLEPEAVKDAIDMKGLKLSNIKAFGYRSGSWPGKFMVTKKNGKTIPLFSIHLRTAINVLFILYGAKRCSLCIDPLAEYADLGFGDFWAGDYSGELSERKQSNLVYQRTPKGAMILKDAVADGSINILSLPENRASKRIFNMAYGKKQKALALLWQMKKLGKPVPNYHFEITEPSPQAQQSLARLRFYNFLREARLRKLILRVLFSPLGKIFDYLNQKRINWRGNYPGN